MRLASKTSVSAAIGPRIGNMIMTLFLTLFLITGILPSTAHLNVYGATSPLKSGTYNHASRFDGDLVVNGVDVSYWQGTASNWETAKRQGVEYAIMRVTWTGYAKGSHNYKNKDSHFTTHYNKAKDAGIMTGAYVFSQATSVKEAKNEAKYAVKTLKGYGITPGDMQLPVYMDYEYCGGRSGRLYGLKAATAKKCAKAFCDVIRDAGYEPGIYANTNFFKSMLGNGASLASDIDLWCAQYYNRNQSGSNYSKWQYSSTGTVGSGKKGLLYTTTGKVGSTDVNFWYIKRTPSPSGDKDIAGMTIYGATAYNYTGKQIKPDFQIYDGSKLLEEGEDYAIGYINNVQKGSLQAYAYIKGVGSYNGYALIPFTIGSGYIKHMSLLSDGNNGYALTNAGVKNTYKVNASISEDENEDDDDALVVIEPEALAADKSAEPGNSSESAEPQSEETEGAGEMTDGKAAEAAGGEAADVEGAAVSAGSAGGGSISASLSETAVTEGSTEAEEESSAEIIVEGSVSSDSAQAAASSSDDNLDLKIGSNKYGGYIRRIPSGTTVSKLLEGLAIKKGFQNKYTVDVINSKGVRQESSTKVKTGMMIGIYDAKGSLAGTADLAVKGDNIKDKKGKDPVWGYASALSVKKTSITSLSGGNGSFTVSVKKLAASASNGYQLRYSLSDSMSSPTSKTISSSYSKVTKEVTGLKHGKTYYIQVRNYKKVNGYKYYSSWSKAGAVAVQ